MRLRAPLGPPGGRRHVGGVWGRSGLLLIAVATDARSHPGDGEGRPVPSPLRAAAETPRLFIS